MEDPEHLSETSMDIHHQTPPMGNDDPTVPSQNAEEHILTIPSQDAEEKIHTEVAHDMQKTGIMDPYAHYNSSPLSDENPYRTHPDLYATGSTELLLPRSSEARKVKKPRRKLRIFSPIGFLIVILWLIGYLLSHLPTNTPPLPPSPSQSSPMVVTPAPTVPPDQAQSLYDRTIQGTPDLDDGLSQPDSYGWDNYARSNTSCSFSSGTYHAKAKPGQDGQNGYFSPCYAKSTNYRDFVFRAEVTLFTGHAAGIVFRADSTNDNAYQFRISTDGTYILNKYQLDSQGQPQAIPPLASGQSSLITIGANQPNRVAVLARGTSLYLFINDKLVDSANDSTYSSGNIGVYADSDANEVEATFGNIQVWKL